MAVHIALLRGINVGGHAKIAMSDLRALLVQLGFPDVQTVLQTGNLVFRSDDASGRELETRLENAAAEYLKFHPCILVRTAAKWESIIAANPLHKEAKRDPSHLVLMLFKHAPDEQAVRELCSAVAGPEIIRVSGAEAYISYPAGIGRSKLTNAFIEARLASSATGRNWNTVLKLAELFRSRRD
jgi:uncharacterized protein (DUF1697 family)